MTDPNSLGSFSQSIRRAAAFRESRPRLRRVAAREAGTAVVEGQPIEQSPFEDPEDGLLSPGFASDVENAILSSNENTPLLNPQDKTGKCKPSEDSPILSSKLSHLPHDRVRQLTIERDRSRAQQKEEDREPLLIERIQRPDGTTAEVILGQSTLPQTIFNSSNVLIGVGMLSLPLGIRYAGWIIGLGSLIASAFATRYTAALLAKCLDVDSSLANFADIAYVAYGEKGRFVTSLIFTLELTAACISLVILFADSLQSLIEGPDLVHWKLLCGCILAPLNFLPMRWLSFTSFLGIFCGILLIVLAFVAGFLKSAAPGSLLDVAATYALPENWKALPLSFGLLMAVWGGHSVFPNIYRDMRHPQKYNRGLVYVFSFVTSIDVVMAVIGYLMYGNETKDEITKNILTTNGYPQAVKVSTLVLIAIIPLTKFPLNCAPIVSTLEVLFRIDARAATIKPNRFNQSPFLCKVLTTSFRLGVTIVIVLLAIVVPSFELISAIMGAAFCFLICTILPAIFHLKMFKGQLKRWQIILDWLLIIFSVILGIAGTVWEFLPRSWMGL